MALIHPISAPAAPECLELFTLPDTQTGVLKRYFVEISPTSVQQGGSVLFDFRSDSSEYCDLSGVLLSGRIQIVRADDSPMTAEDIAFLISNYPCTMIKQLDVKLGNQIISLPQQMFPYEAAIKTTLTRGQESKTTQLAADGFFKHKPGHMNDVLVQGDEDYKERAELFQLSQWVDFETKLPASLFQIKSSC